MASSPRPMPKKLAYFDLIRPLGTGGMAEVFLAKKSGAEATFKLLVVKRILQAHGSSQKFMRMFAEEAQLATRLNHANIVQVYDFQDFGEEGQLLSMEYVEGPDLRRLQRAMRAKSARLSPYVAAYIVGEVAKGLHYAHERKDEGGAPLEIVHRDVSPQNILLSFDGAVKIADFGIATAKIVEQEPGILKGKTSYMSPEQARGEKVDRRSDIYSLGVVFHELLTGRPLHGAAEGRELLEAVRSGTVEPPSMYVRGVPPELEAIVMKALARQKDDRFTTAREMASAISRVLFQLQEPVDASSLESVIHEFVSREHTSPGEELPRTGSRDSESVSPDRKNTSSSGGEDSHTLDSSLWTRQRRLRSRVDREVRHVALVGLRLHGQEQLEHALGRAQTARVAEQVRDIFETIAYQHGARWSWKHALGRVESTSPAGAIPGFALAEGLAIVGLMANPSQAASHAAQLAIRTHEALMGASDSLPSQLTASISIVRGIAEGKRDSAGHLTEYKLQSPASSLAELLGKTTPAGSTWVAGGIYRVARRDFKWQDVQSLDLEQLGDTDLPKTMRVYDLVRQLTREEKRTLQSLAPRDLVGRDAELAELHAAYHQSVTPATGDSLGDLTVRLVVGEMGIGKSALLATFLAELPPDARELRVECSPHRSETPFSNAAQWLRELTGIRQDEPVEQARSLIEEMLGGLPDEDHSEEIVQRMSELAVGRVPQVADEAAAALDGRLLGVGLRTFLARAAQQSPLVVSIDGVQWIDISSLELFVSLIRQTASLPILVLLITRPEEHVMPYVDGFVRVELSGLSPENQVRLVEAHIGASAGVEEACADLIPRAAGNPYFLLEMVDALLERGKLDLKEDESGQVTLTRVREPNNVGQALPSTLEQLIADRLNELPPEERAVVDWLAVAGGPLGHADLTALSESETDEAIARLCARGLCDLRVESVDVRHPLTRDVAYLALDARDRADMHQQLGELLSQRSSARGLGAAIVARHFSRGREPERAAGPYLEAAAVARLSFQLKLAATYYESALEVLPDFDERCLEPYSVLEDICRVQGRWKERKRHLEALRECAKRSGRSTWIATALIRHAQFDFDAGHLTHGLGLAQLGEELAERSKSPTLQVQAQALMAEMLRDLGEMQGALASCDRALSIADRAQVPPRLRAEVLRAQATLLLRVGRVQEAISAHAEAIAVFRQTLARREEARAKSSLAFAMFVLGQFEDAIALALEAIRIDLSIGGRFQIARTLSTIGQCYSRLGDVRRARAYLSRARDAHEKHEDQDSLADTLLCCAELHTELGEHEEAGRYLDEAKQVGDFRESSYDAVHARLIRALLARKAGNSGAAVMHAFDARQVAEAQAYVAFHFYAMAIEAAARVDIGEQHTAILLATTTMGAIETLQGSEYGLETRALCVETLSRTHSPQGPEMRARAAGHVRKLHDAIRSPELRRGFLARPLVEQLLQGSSQAIVPAK